uniref:t-SNARE coiled-coil homology domain-containing protein n=1 Tax=Macrostomum lignano TaxID=282301 RepID=A0A1I8IBJ8_9PLAT
RSTNPRVGALLVPRNGIPVFCPSITDGACGDVLYFHSYRCPGLVLDAIEEHPAGEQPGGVRPQHRHDSSGGGGREAPHLQCQPHAQRGPTLPCSSTPARSSMAATPAPGPTRPSAGGKIRLDARPVKVYSDATLAFPLNQKEKCFLLRGEQLGCKRLRLPCKGYPRQAVGMSDSRNPFYTEDKNPFSLGGAAAAGTRSRLGRTGRLAASCSYNPGGGYGYEGRSTVQQQVQASQSRQLETQRRALQSMYYSSESMGVDTAQELVRQGEVLNRTEEKLDHIEAVQKESQGHINSLSSMFGASRTGSAATRPRKRSSAAQQYEPPAPSLTRPWPSAPRRGQESRCPATGAAGYQQQQQRQQPQTSYDRAFSENLGEMEHGMGRLKQLAMGLGGEIDRQNSQLERMSVKTDKTNAKMDEQNTQMNRILYGSKAPPAAKK